MMLGRVDFLPFGKPEFSDKEIEAVTRVLRSGWIGMGPETLAFEEELASFVGARAVVTVNSCTSALFLSLLVSGVGPGDEVICPSLTWCSTANVALYLGAKVVFCDVDPETFCVTPESVASCLSERTKAVMIVHMGGKAADVREISALVPDDVVLIEDAAHALGSSYPDGRMVGGGRNLTCFSFYANKNLSTGEGGAIALNDSAVAEHLVSLRLHGLSSDAWKRYSHPTGALSPVLHELGYKMNYTDLQAAIGRVQLRRQPEFADRRLAIASYYVERLRAELPDWKVQTGVTDPGHARHLFQIIMPRQYVAPDFRNTLVRELRRMNIGAGIHYPPLHEMPLYSGNARGALPCTEDLAGRLITLPISGGMSVDDARDVFDALVHILKNSG